MTITPTNEAQDAEPAETPGPATGASRSGGEISHQLRGSSLLLVGRLLSVVSNLVVQVLIARHLTKGDNGIFLYALSVATMVGTIITLGLDRGLSRFVAIYEERDEVAKMFGTVAMQVVAIVGLGSAAIGLAFGFQGWIGRSLVDDPRIAPVLAVMVLLAPVQALDDMVAGLFAVFAKPRVIFLRKYVMAPGMRIAVVAVLIAADKGVVFLAGGYVVAGLFGLMVYGTLLVRVLRARGLLDPHPGPRVTFPVKEVSTFTLPLIASDLMFVLLNTSDVVILGRYAGKEAVASYRVVQPVARMNQLVMNSFVTLFGPLMARLFARGDGDGCRDLYWRTAAWVAVATFPIFALTFGLARPITETLFGSQYAGSAVYLTVLAGAYYFNASLGFNGVTLKMLGHVRYAAAIAIAAGALNVALNLTLIPTYGAGGAAAGTAITIAAYNVAKQLGLRRGGISRFEPDFAPVYATVVAAAVALVAVEVVVRPSALVALPLAAVASFAVLWVGRSRLHIGDTFPKVRRIPVLGPWLAGPP